MLANGPQASLSSPARTTLRSGVLAGCLIGSAVATAVLVHSPTIPTLTQLIGGAGAEPVVALSGSRSRAR